MSSITFSSLFDTCVYIRVDERDLAREANTIGSSSFESGKSWTGAQKLMDAAEHIGKVVPVIFSDAADSNDPIYWAVLKEIKIVVRGEKKFITHYTVDNLQRLKTRHKLNELVIKSTGNRITPIRKAGYIFCITPTFLKGEF